MNKTIVTLAALSLAINAGIPKGTMGMSDPSSDLANLSNSESTIHIGSNLEGTPSVILAASDSGSNAPVVTPGGGSFSNKIGDVSLVSANIDIGRASVPNYFDSADASNSSSDSSTQDSANTGFKEFVTVKVPEFFQKLKNWLVGVFTKWKFDRFVTDKEWNEKYSS